MAGTAAPGPALLYAFLPAHTVEPCIPTGRRFDTCMPSPTDDGRLHVRIWSKFISFVSALSPLLHAVTDRCEDPLRAADCFPNSSASTANSPHNTHTYTTCTHAHTHGQPAVDVAADVALAAETHGMRSAGADISVYRKMWRWL